MNIILPGNEVREVNRDYCIPYSPTKYPSNYKKLASFTMNWHTRLVMESVVRPTLFVTFTYDDEHYVENRLDERGIRFTLARDFKLFVKRFRNNLLRKHNGNYYDFNYYDITERGDDGRLHHHALIYGIPFRTYRSINKKGQRVDLVHFDEYTDEISKSWGQGFVFFEAACKENIKYVTKYLHKRMISQDYTSVKGRGLGLAYLTDNRKEFLHSNKLSKIVIGRKTYYLPRYLKKKIYSDEELKEVNKLIEDENYKKIMSDVPAEFNANRHYVYHPNSNQLRKSFQKVHSKLIKFEEIGILNANELRSDFYEYIYEYDESLDLLMAYPVSDYYYWYRLKTRYLENLKMKRVYDVRL